MKKPNKEYIFTFRGDASDRMLLDELMQNYELMQSDIIRIALWEYAANSKNSFLKSSTKELAAQKIVMFRADTLRELEYINNKIAFFFDGFRTMLSNYKNKYVPLSFVKKYVSIKLVAMYSLFNKSAERKEYLGYLRKNFLHFYPEQSKWFSLQLKFIKSSKTQEKDRLLEKMKGDFNERYLPKMPKGDGSVSMRSDKPVEVPEAFAKRAKAEDIKVSGKK